MLTTPERTYKPDDTTLYEDDIASNDLDVGSDPLEEDDDADSRYTRSLKYSDNNYYDDNEEEEDDDDDSNPSDELDNNSEEETESKQLLQEIEKDENLLDSKQLQDDKDEEEEEQEEQEEDKINNDTNDQEYKESKDDDSNEVYSKIEEEYSNVQDDEPEVRKHKFEQVRKMVESYIHISKHPLDILHYLYQFEGGDKKALKQLRLMVETRDLILDAKRDNFEELDRPKVVLQNLKNAFSDITDYGLTSFLNKYYKGDETTLKLYRKISTDYEDEITKRSLSDKDCKSSLSSKKKLKMNKPTKTTHKNVSKQHNKKNTPKKPKHLLKPKVKPNHHFKKPLTSKMSRTLHIKKQKQLLTNKPRKNQNVHKINNGRPKLFRKHRKNNHKAMAFAKSKLTTVLKEANTAFDMLNQAKIRRRRHANEGLENILSTYQGFQPSLSKPQEEHLRPKSKRNIGSILAVMDGANKVNQLGNKATETVNDMVSSGAMSSSRATIIAVITLLLFSLTVFIVS